MMREKKMEESSSSNGGEGGMMIRKGPWKPEEDQVLLNHVKKYGPRDWSSIRSKGLLLRTGKSCRLRWVNKLRPNLKNGCKFTVEEERIVIELQAQLGNKWATIATHLAGRTDNDVKNFWSSRQKRLARILHHSSHSPNSSSLLNYNKSHKSSSSSSSSTATQTHPSLSLQGTKISSCLMEGEPISKRQRSSSSFYPSYSFSEANNPINIEPLPIENYPNINDFHNQEIPFPSIPHLQTDLPFPPETQELIDRLDSSFLEPFGYAYEPALLDDGFRFMPCSGGESSSQVGGKGANDNNPIAPDSFFDDFPSDMFDQIEPLPSPSGW